MLKKIAAAGLIAGSLGFATSAMAAGEACLDVAIDANGTPVAAAQCVPLP